MRLIFGIIIGIALTVGGAYIADSFPPAQPAGEATAANGHMVNWDVVHQRFADLGVTIREAWNKVTGATAKPSTTSN